MVPTIITTLGFILLSAHASLAQTAGRDVSVFQNTVYWTNWSVYDRNYPPQKLPVSQINQVLYSFMNIQNDGTVFTRDKYADIEQHDSSDSWNNAGNNAYGAVKQLALLKRSNRHLKVILSIGGWTMSSNFPAVAADAAKRANFAESAVTMVKDYGFDGIDIDWEYPATPSDAANFILLLKAVRAELDSYRERAASDYHFLLTAATPAAPEHYNVLRLKEMGEILDYVNIMTYDYAGGWDLSAVGHQANLYPNPSNPESTPFSTDRAITDYIEAGVPGRKIVMGIPLYGRGYEGALGLGQAASSASPGTWEVGVYDYKNLPLEGSFEEYDYIAGASYSVDTVNHRIISYDTITSVKKKVEYIRNKGLGGTMFWEASGDRTDENSIIANCFRGQDGDSRMDKTDNLLLYPESIYDNIRTGLV
ncbi:family 18 glycosyl hydrolase [Microdochium trichocladiopsis]|uniref:chitinase n=1 Tax=Microdochium trichocladiopsis TaxID=1682393 RepID=A0A9P8XS09_9PEZI|nr:family 18 glycosyl hydrolase [Microdochium trichocladiopsis]KAH7012082.1 family 18 glycosyl hydrolase [Microdochium trichocladiopsis]